MAAYAILCKEEDDATVLAIRFNKTAAKIRLSQLATRIADEAAEAFPSESVVNILEGEPITSISANGKVLYTLSIQRVVDI